MNFVFDLDGTICFKGKPLSHTITDALHHLQENGHDVIFASARPIRDMLPVLDSDFHSVPLIGGNGSLISKDGKVSSTTFTNSQVKEIKRMIDKYEATYLIDSDWDYAYTGPIDHPLALSVDPLKTANRISLDSLTSIVKVLFITANHMDDLLVELSNMDVVIHHHKNESVIDISPKNIDKWSALRKINIAKHDYIAFGNDENDITMFQHAAFSVMIGTHSDLSCYANKSLSLSNDIEQKIADELNRLSTLSFSGSLT